MYNIIICQEITITEWWINSSCLTIPFSIHIKLTNDFQIIYYSLHSKKKRFDNETSLPRACKHANTYTLFLFCVTFNNIIESELITETWYWIEFALAENVQMMVVEQVLHTYNTMSMYVYSGYHFSKQNVHSRKKLSQTVYITTMEQFKIYVGKYPFKGSKKKDL